MATLDATVSLPATALPDDTLRLSVVNVAGVAYDAATASQLTTTDRLVGDIDVDDDVLIGATVDLDGGCGVHEFAVLLIDAAGNESEIFRSFELLADHPAGNTNHTVATTGNPNEALLTWA